METMVTMSLCCEGAVLSWCPKPFSQMKNPDFVCIRHFLSTSKAILITTHVLCMIMMSCSCCTVRAAILCLSLPLNAQPDFTVRPFPVVQYSSSCLLCVIEANISRKVRKFGKCVEMTSKIQLKLGRTLTYQRPDEKPT